MRLIAKRLLTLEAGPHNPLKHMSDNELRVRINEINCDSRALGLEVEDVDLANPDLYALQRQNTAIACLLNEKESSRAGVH